MTDLPLDARARLSALEEASPEAAAIMRRLFPSDEKDRQARAIAQAERTRQAQETERNRIELCKRAQEGDFGKDVEGATKQVLSETGGEFTSMAVNRILMALKRARIEGRAERPKGAK
jgi:hypothetical protein